MNTSNIFRFNGVDPFDNWKVYKDTLLGYYPRNSLINLYSMSSNRYIDQGSYFVIKEGIKEIGPSCFKNNTRFKVIIIPSSVISIKKNAFNKDITLMVYPGSYSERYAIKNNIKYRYI